MHTHNSFRSCITAAFSTRLSAVLFPSFLISSCPTASLVPCNTNTHLVICTRLLSPQQPGHLLFSIHMSLNQEFQVPCPTPQQLLAMVRTDAYHATSRSDMSSLALLMRHGCWQGVGAHTVHTTPSVEKLTASCHRSDHQQTGFQRHNHGYIYKGTTTATTFHATNTLYYLCSHMGQVKNTHIFCNRKMDKILQKFQLFFLV